MFKSLVILALAGAISAAPADPTASLCGFDRANDKHIGCAPYFYCSKSLDSRFGGVCVPSEHADRFLLMCTYHGVVDDVRVPCPAGNRCIANPRSSLGGYCFDSE